MTILLAALALFQPEPDRLRTELASEVQKMLDQGTPSSAVFVVGIGGAYHCFANSGEVLFVLSEALPYLPEAMSPQVKDYLHKVVVDHPPWAPAFLLTSTPWSMYAPGPPEVKGPPRLDVPLVNAYFAWRYARATGDWASVEKGYPDFKARASRIGETPEDYPQTIAAIGLSGLSRHFGPEADALLWEAKAARGLEAGRDYEKIFDQSLGRLLGSHDWTYPPLTERRKEKVLITAYAPEILSMLGRTARDDVARHAGAVMDAWARTWYLTRPNLPTFFGPRYFKGGPDQAPNFMKKAWKGEQEDFGQENATWTPDIACTLFLLRAGVLGEKRAQLEKYLDVPWVRVGDLYHLLKLVACLKAP
ncbi:MAG TPA: hypothetical protein VEN81_17810 [Planctomycetota bacterium]|nr:hypothetical protein [Planctomycetota bacterium]